MLNGRGNAQFIGPVAVLASGVRSSNPRSYAPAFRTRYNSYREKLMY
jgi:hypothetical protein